jgi:amidohydrolase
MRLTYSFILVMFTSLVWAQTSSLTTEVETAYPDAHAFYLDLHQNPELSSHETQTAQKLAGRLRDLGYTVTEHVGGTGVVAVLKNGSGPTVMLRTELDALPVEEKTGLAYASKVRTKDDSGREVPVMHACGHDLHMASLFATAAIMAHSKSTWHGTIILIGQPAEETITGAKRMIADGLMTRFPEPDFAVALHVDNYLPAGKIGVGPGYRFSNADSVHITIYGRGGHGSTPNSTIDPVVIAARVVVTLQTIVSREIKPGEVGVITVGYIQAGTKNNIIPDQAELGITVRSYKPEVRKLMFASIERITKAEATAAGATQEPKVDRYESTDAVYNDPALAQRMQSTLESTLGKENVVIQEPLLVSEDFSYYTAQGVPSFYFNLGGADPAKYAEAKSAGKNLPNNHSSLFAPDVYPALHTGIEAEVAALRNLLQ